MSLIFEMAIKAEIKEQLKHFLYTDNEPSGIGHMTGGMTPAKRRTHKMAWMDFSDKELRIVNEVEKKPGMKQSQICALMSTHDAAYADGTCEEGMTKFLLANLCDRKVLISSPKQGYTLNDSSTPPPCKLPILPPQ
jgi:hypothetical protein